jgi:hypothetical protein
MKKMPKNELDDVALQNRIYELVTPHPFESSKKEGVFARLPEHTEAISTK